MTNEEAIDVLEHNFPSSCYTDLCEAVNVAIEALKWEKSDDAIDRQAAIRIASIYCHSTKVAKELAKLTSVQPVCKDINVPCKDAISRQAAIDTEGLDEQIRCEMCRNPMHTNRGCDGNCKYDEKLYEKIMQILGERIKPLPSVQPDIIACGDCKHYIPHDKRCGYWNHGVQPLMWCSQAERRADG